MPLKTGSRILKKIAKELKKKPRGYSGYGPYEKADFAKRGLYIKGSYSKSVPAGTRRKKPSKKKTTKR